MNPVIDPAGYDAWYDTPRGAWVGRVEFSLLMRLLRSAPGNTLLDVGCGTGHFSRRFSAAGLHVTGVDPDAATLAFAAAQSVNIRYLQASALRLPFADRSFDHVAAITSLCFVEPPAQAIKEMWRITGRSLVLGLLNRHSLLNRAKYGRGGYAGARWDSVDEVRQWLAPFDAATDIEIRSAVFLPSGTLLARAVEHCLPTWIPYGSFLAVSIRRLL